MRESEAHLVRLEELLHVVLDDGALGVKVVGVAARSLGGGEILELVDLGQKDLDEPRREHYALREVLQRRKTTRVRPGAQGGKGGRGSGPCA